MRWRWKKNVKSWCTGTYDPGTEKYFSRMRAFLVRTAGMQEELKNVMQGIGLEEEEIHECMV